MLVEQYLSPEKKNSTIAQQVLLTSLVVLVYFVAAFMQSRNVNYQFPPLSFARMDPILIRHRFRKVLFSPVHTGTGKLPLWRAFSKNCVFVDRFHGIRVDGSRIRNEKVAFSNEIGYVWTGPKFYVRKSCPKKSAIVL